MPGVALAKISAYPGYVGPLKPSGFVLLTESAANTITMTPFVTGLETNVQGGFHVHDVSNTEEAECETAGVGGHYNDILSESDVWASSPKYSTDEDGISNHWARSSTSGFSLNGDTMPVSGKAVVMHSADGEKVACGMISLKTRLEVAILSKLPSYEGDVNMQGVAIFEVLEDKTLQGLVEISGHSVTPAAVHIHEGFDCSKKHGNGGGHLASEGKTDAWSANGSVTVDTETGIGSAEIIIPYDATVGEFTYDVGPLNIHSRAVVVHEAGGARVGCGILTNFGADKTTENPMNQTNPGALEVVLAVVAIGIMLGVLFAMYKQHVRAKKNKNLSEEDVELRQHSNTMI
ncbi:hypothetical protein TrST_g10314 [Triparma strigata]|uniref:Superoxide dismutase copper/zinc binding domain-containing protein n=1 Tax=Triparma strigata TaxID=1606541 RepID=A0A9W7BTW2_9STRA|nr:hypothetical protein TrST_g10314 [Triparma strigata]